MTPLEAAARVACGIGERYDWAGRNVGYEWADGAARDYWINSTRAAISAYLKACAECGETLFAIGEAAECELAAQVRLGEAASFNDVGRAVIRTIAEAMLAWENVPKVQLE